MIKLNYKFFVLMGIIFLNPKLSHSESEFGTTQVKIFKYLPVLKVDKNKIFEISSPKEDQYAGILALELGNIFKREQLKVKISTTQNEVFSKLINKKTLKEKKSDYLFEIETAAPSIYQKYRNDFNAHFFVIKLVDLKTGEVLKEYIENTPSTEERLVSNGQQLQLKFEAGANLIFKNFFIGYEDDIGSKNILYAVPFQSKNCQLADDALLALQANLLNEASKKLKEAKLKCNQNDNAELLASLNSTLFLKMDDYNKAINILSDHLKRNPNSEQIRIQMEKIKKRMPVKWN